MMHVWYSKGAEKRSTYAQFNLGLMYFHGRGVAQDEKHTGGLARTRAILVSSVRLLPVLCGQPR
jgi:TPR repeat protein